MANLFEAGYYGIRDTKKWLLWIAVFGVVGYFLLREKEPIPPSEEISAKINSFTITV